MSRVIRPLRDRHSLWPHSTNITRIPRRLHYAPLFRFGGHVEISLWSGVTDICWLVFQAFSSGEREDVLRARFLLEGFKGGEDYLSVPCIRPMHGLAVVAKSHLSESLRISGDFGALRPRVTIGMQGNSVHSGFPAGPLEMGRAVPFFQLREGGKQRTFLRQFLQYGSKVIFEMDDARLPRFEPIESDDSSAPVDVFGGEQGNVGLAGSQVPGDFVKYAPFSIRVGGDDPCVLTTGYGSPLSLV